MTSRRLAIFLLPMLLGACKDSEAPTDTTDTTDTTDSTTDSTTDPTDPTTDSTTTTTEPTTTEPTTTTTPACDYAACAENCSQWSDEGCDLGYFGYCEADKCICELNPGDCAPSIPPTDCGDAICADDQLCVQPGLDCDLNQDPPLLFTPPPTCQDLPSECWPSTNAELPFCLASKLCKEGVSGDPKYDYDRLECPPVALSCP